MYKLGEEGHASNHEEPGPVQLCSLVLTSIVDLDIKVLYLVAEIRSVK